MIQYYKAFHPNWFIALLTDLLIHGTDFCPFLSIKIIQVWQSSSKCNVSFAIFHEKLAYFRAIKGHLSIYLTLSHIKNIKVYQVITGTRCQGYQGILGKSGISGIKRISMISMDIKRYQGISRISTNIMSAY